MLRRVFGPKREEVAGGWRRRGDVARSMHGRDEKWIQYFLGKPEGKRHLGRPWEDTRMGLGEMGWKLWIGLMWLRIGTSGKRLWSR
jgi:hypothetical protein